MRRHIASLEGGAISLLQAEGTLTRSCAHNGGSSPLSCGEVAHSMVRLRLEMRRRAVITAK